MTDLLKRYGHPSHAHTGSDALQQIKRQAPDLILLDLSLPDMHGLELAKMVRANARTNSIPILAMSANRMDKKNVCRWVAMTLSSNHSASLVC